MGEEEEEGEEEGEADNEAHQNALHFLAEGHAFVEHPTGRGKPGTRTVVLGNSKQLYWYKPPKKGPAKLEETQSLVVDKHLRVLRGKQTKAWSGNKTSKQADESCCFTLERQGRG